MDDDELEFLIELPLEDVTVWVAPAGGNEFTRPSGWQSLRPDGNAARLKEWRPGMALCLNTGGLPAVVDVDPRNGGDIDKVRKLLADLGVRIFAEVTTPGGGKHFYVAGHPDLRTVHSTEKNERLPGFPGVDIQGPGANVFLPGTRRPKWGNRGYTVESNDLLALTAEGDPDGAERLMQWAAEQTATRVRKQAAQRNGDATEFEFDVAAPWPEGQRPNEGQQKYLDKVLASAEGQVIKAVAGGRNDALFGAAMKCGSFVAGAGLDLDTVVERLWEASVQNGLASEDGHESVYATIRSRLRIGMDTPRAVPDREVGGESRREIEWVSMDDIADAAAKWAWEYDGHGRIQVGALTLFGGRPGTAKSTCARWFVARLSRGELEGCWKGKPQTVAYVAAEETAQYVLKPSLRAHGADMSRVVTPRVKIAEGKYAALLAEDDEHQLIEDLRRRGVTVIVIDPIMATMKSKTDIYRTNELREALTPWLRIAEAIDGIVIGLVHFVKGSTGDLVAAINGGSAFGEMARCVFGFAKETLPTGSLLRVMTQGKNSCGHEDLSLEFSVEGTVVTVSTGERVAVGTFVLGDESDVTAGEILSRNKGPRALRPEMQKVLDFVNGWQQGPVTPKDVARAGLAKDNKAAGQMLKRLADRALISHGKQGHYWRLGGANQQIEELRAAHTREEMKK
ncbi:AAA family ATPase [Mycobacterium sp. pV006]|uniref:AAA family ATPase n=1 Tax=Mycobacterium sp. pV006 TaxID=3238983 RepID=UPI00351ACD45